MALVSTGFRLAATVRYMVHSLNTKGKANLLVTWFGKEAAVQVLIGVFKAAVENGTPITRLVYSASGRTFLYTAAVYPAPLRVRGTLGTCLRR